MWNDDLNCVGLILGPIYILRMILWKTTDDIVTFTVFIVNVLE